MKKYIVFISSFAVFYGLFQIVSGLIITAFHNPTFALMNSNLSQEVSFGNIGAFPLVTILFIATLAYFFTQKLGTVKLKSVLIKK
ncbi:hypothetical protein R4Z10_12540 [Niallia sp. XMNu-256]|uniref:hypothetical protein n=1 Tax=Niallia sp. XMNu-256 TaxID=3082444 RepID=UPI0030D0B8C6